MNQLYSSLKALLLELFEAATFWDTAKRKWVAALKDENHDTADFTLRIVERIDVDDLYIHHSSDISSLTSSALVVEAVMNDSSLVEILPPWEPLPTTGSLPPVQPSQTSSLKDLYGHYIKMAIIDPFVRNYLTATNVLTFDDALFQRTFKRMSEFVLTKRYIASEVTPLFGLEMSSNVLQLEPNLRIRMVRPEELETWLNPHWVLAMPLTNQKVDMVRFVLENDYERSPLEGGNHDGSTVRATVISALRLVTNRNIFGAFTYEPRFNGWMWRPGPVYPHIASMHAPVRMRMEDQSTLEQLWATLKALPNAKAKVLRLAIQRWESGFDRIRPEDKLVDYRIGLDSLYSQRKLEPEVAKIARGSGHDPDSIIKLLNVSKLFRNGVVHENSRMLQRLEAEGYSLSAIADRTGDWLRTSILHYLGE